MKRRQGGPSTTLGSLIVGLRRRNGWTLSQMSVHCGIPLSTLSKVEHGRLTLTYDRLVQLSRRLNVQISDLFAEAEADEKAPELVVTARRSIGRVRDAVRITNLNYDCYYVCKELRQKRMVPIVIRVLAKTLEQFGALNRHAGEEYIHILSGGVALHTEFYDPVVLGTGEGVYIDSNMAHAYILADCQEATILRVCSGIEQAILESKISLPVHNEPVTVTLRKGLGRKRT